MLKLGVRSTDNLIYGVTTFCDAVFEISAIVD